MSKTREDLHEMLVECLGSKYVYFQPPETLKLTYPCIIYERIGMSVKFADDSKYIRHKKYQITVVDSNPISSIPDKVLDIKYCRFVRHYATQGLNYDVFEIAI